MHSEKSNNHANKLIFVLTRIHETSGTTETHTIESIMTDEIVVKERSIVTANAAPNAQKGLKTEGVAVHELDNRSQCHDRRLLAYMLVALEIKFAKSFVAFDFTMATKDNKNAPTVPVCSSLEICVGWRDIWDRVIAPRNPAIKSWCRVDLL